MIWCVDCLLAEHFNEKSVADARARYNKEEAEKCALLLCHLVRLVFEDMSEDMSAQNETEPASPHSPGSPNCKVGDPAVLLADMRILFAESDVDSSGDLDAAVRPQPSVLQTAVREP